MTKLLFILLWLLIQVLPDEVVVRLLFWLRRQIVRLS